MGNVSGHGTDIKYNPLLISNNFEQIDSVVVLDSMDIDKEHFFYNNLREGGIKTQNNIQ